jgi:hypothetical protein
VVVEFGRQCVSGRIDLYCKYTNAEYEENSKSFKVVVENA